MSDLLFKGAIIMTFFEKCRYALISVNQTIELIRYLKEPVTGLDKTSGEYQDRCQYNMYMRQSRVRVMPDGVTVRIRIPEKPNWQKKLKGELEMIKEKVNRMNNNQLMLSIDCTSDPYYYIITGTKK